MVSPALARWSGERSRQLDDLFAAHAALGGRGPGRRWRTTELNRVLLVDVASHFQGFARELHDYGAVTFARLAQPRGTGVPRILALAMQAERLLDRRNATEAALHEDFSRFGLDLWPAMAREDRRTVAWRGELGLLNSARNAIVHDDRQRLEALAAAGYPITLVTIRHWRRAAAGLAVTMDAVVSDHFAAVFEVARPW